MSKQLELSTKLAEIGAQLKHGRETKDLTLEQVHAKTLISKSHLQAIEEGNLDLLPELVYVHGFIRKYGQAIGMLEIAAEFPSHSQTNLTQAESTAPFKSHPELRPWHLYVFYVSIVIGSVMVLARLFREPLPSRENPSPNLSRSAKVEPIVAAPTAPQVVPSALPVNVSVTMAGESWLRITVDDEVAFEGILPEGTQQLWSGNREIILRTGNAAAVELRFNQTPPRILGNEGEVVELSFDRDSVKAVP